MPRIAYPQAPRVDQVDVYHGVEVRDPYRWMEDVTDPRLGPWLDAQAGLVEGFLSASPCRDRLRARIAEVWNVEGAGVPWSRGGRWFQERREGGHGGVYVMDDLDGPARLLLSRDGEEDDVLVADLEVSPDGTRLLWCTTRGGSDWRTWHVMDVADGRVHPDVVPDTKLWAVWMPDSASFLYYGFPSEGRDATRATANPQLRLHRLGTDTADDELVYENRDNPSYFFPSVTSDGRFLVLTFVMAGDNGLAYARIGEPWSFERLAKAERQMWFLGSHGDTFIATASDDAPMGRVVAIDLNRPDEWRTIVPETDVPLPAVARSALIGEWVLAVRERLGAGLLSLHRIDGGDGYELELPTTCRLVPRTVAQTVGIAPDGGSFYFGVTSPASPSTILRHDLASRTTSVVSEATAAPGLAIDAQVVWAESADGTRVPMTLVRRAGASEPNPPVVIEGYGGGGDSMEPYDFSPWKVAWLEAGGVVASAHIRGGGELGDAWQRAAERTGKLLAMEDLIGCAEWVLSTGYTTSDRLAITGRSSGGMLAAAAAVARPELFAACVPEVGMFDPLRYHLFGLGRLMVQEYGCSEDPIDFEVMYAYSPLHNVRPETAYPAFLITVHTDDDRVAPGGGYRFAATVQEAQDGHAPILLLVRTGAGHHGGTPEGDKAERGDILTFLARTLRVGDC